MMADWIAVVDDDTLNLKSASHILAQRQMRVSTLKSGEALLDFLEYNKPDLVLLDIHMPAMDGFEALLHMREMENGKDVPVIFLTADEDTATETQGLDLGAMDFIKKPFVPEVLVARVLHTIELTRLEQNLAQEVEKKTAEIVFEQKKNARLSMQIVRSLTLAIDAKDTYTNGHSIRVAFYAKEIARRFGYDAGKQSDMYMMGLLHDVGKIGIPDSIINKPGKLTGEEYDIIKTHPEMGEKILKNIDEMPALATGAKCHHERIDGNGYPDGLKGEQIPEEARIISVADAYDAMTSHRSYREPLTQAKARQELVDCMGAQFDETFAKIMISIIDEDTEFKLREK